MRNRIFGAIGIVWGGAILISSIMKGGPQGGGSYAVGQWTALVFAVVMFAAGVYYLIVGDGSSKSKSGKSGRTNRR